MIISIVPDDLIDDAWPLAKPHLERAVNTLKGKYTIDALLIGLRKGTLRLWVVVDEENGDEIVAAFTTRLIVYPERLAMAIDWVGGKQMKSWLDKSMAIMVKYAQDQGCSHIEGYGRRAWARAMQKFGMEPEYTAFRMEI